MGFLVYPDFLLAGYELGGSYRLNVYGFSKIHMLSLLPHWRPSPLPTLLSDLLIMWAPTYSFSGLVVASGQSPCVLTRLTRPWRFGCCLLLQPQPSHSPTSLLCSQVGFPSAVTILPAFRTLSMVLLPPEKLPVLPLSLGSSSLRWLLKCDFPGKTSVPPRQSPH